MKRRSLWLAVLAGILALFVTGMAVLFQWRFEAGDIYPPYSTLRTDPMGSKGFYESLERLRTTQPRRNFALLERVDDPGGATWLFLGVSQEDFADEWKDWRPALEKILSRQGRVVIVFESEHSAPAQRNSRRAPKQIAVAPKISLEQAWGFRFGYAALAKEKEQYQPVTVRLLAEESALPGQLAWHSALYFSPAAKEWKTIYARNDKPVVMERPLGGGTLVLASDPYLFSNEALRTERAAGLLSWYIGPNGRVVFDESHLGVTEEPGMGSLLRQYRLHWTMGSLLLLALLFVWKNSTSLLPPQAEDAAGIVVTGLDSAAGFLNLLRRGVSPKELPRICLEEWKSRGPRTKTRQPARVARLEAALQEDTAGTGASRNPVGLYRKLCILANEKDPAPARPAAPPPNT